MARNCNCAGSSCSCSVTAGAGISVTGTGTAANPFVVVNTGADIAQAVMVNDSDTVDLTVTGAGTDLDPLIITADVIAKVESLSDVSNPAGAPLAGQVATYVGTSGTDGHWEFRKPLQQFTTANRPSAVTVGAGLSVFDTTLNRPIYSDGAIWRKFADDAAA